MVPSLKPRPAIVVHARFIAKSVNGLSGRNVHALVVWVLIHALVKSSDMLYMVASSARCSMKSDGVTTTHVHRTVRWSRGDRGYHRAAGLVGED